MADGSTHISTSQAVDAAVDARAMLKHAFYQAWSAGSLTRENLRDYAAQYFHHVDAFPRAVSAVHANCPDRHGRRLLAENLAEEEGVETGKTDHATLWMDFAEGLGATPETVAAVDLEPETEALISTFRNLSRQSYAAGLGALYAYESQLPAVASTKIDGLARFYGVDDADVIRFFTVHEKADVEHAEVCRSLLDKLEGADRTEALMAADQLAAALQGFLTGVGRRTGVC